MNPCVIARNAGGIFFPQRPELKLDQRGYSPSVIDRIVSINAEVKSGAKAKKIVQKSCEICVSVPTIMDLTANIGEELYNHLQEQASAHAEKRLTPEHPEAPQVAAVSVDGGRIMTRAKAGRGVHDQAWKESKNACLLTMSSTPSEEDPHPEFARLFRQSKLRGAIGP